MRPLPELSDVIEFVREQTRVRAGRPIDGRTRLEADLGVTGDDGVDLLRAAEERFAISFGRDLRPVFGLEPNEVLLGPEGLELPGLAYVWHWLRRTKPAVVTDLTVGELHEAILRRAGG